MPTGGTRSSRPKDGGSMKRRNGMWIAAAITLAVPGIAGAQHEHMHMAPPDTTAKAPARRHAAAGRRPATHAHGQMTMPSHEHMAMPSHEHMAMTSHEHMTMSALYGPYAATREASGTSWQPESAPHEALHVMHGPWTLMLHG